MVRSYEVSAPNFGDVSIGVSDRESRRWDLMPTRVFALDLQLSALEELQTYATTGSTIPPRMKSHLAEFFEAKREVVILGRTVEELMESLYDSPPHLYALSVDTLTWRKLKAKGRAPSSYFDGESCLLAKKQTMYVYTVMHEENFFCRLYMLTYDRATPVWSLVKTSGNVPTQLTSSCMDLMPDRGLLLFGGDFQGPEEPSQIYKYNISTAVWTKAKSVNNGSVLGPNDFRLEGKVSNNKSSHRSVCTGDEVLYFGGGGNSRGVEYELREVLLLSLRK